jgi:tRNA threonylcarbamoyladenosine biosynthesis protein TsaB
MLLAIDTSTSLASLALLDGFTVHASHQWNVGQRHSVEIFNALDQLLNPLGEDTVSDISAIAVATGPGSFNGTRVAVTVAKTLAFVWQVPLVGVPTLHGIAQAYVNSRDAVADGGVLNGTLLMAQHTSVLALLEAGRDELYTCWYDLDARSIPDIAEPLVFVRPRGDIAIAKVDDIVTSAPSGEIVAVGEISDTHYDALHAELGERVQIVSSAHVASGMRGEGIGLLAQARLQTGESDDPLALEPTYVRRPNITTSTRHPVPGQPPH